jgi:hypothetical protein
LLAGSGRPVKSVSGVMTWENFRQEALNIMHVIGLSSVVSTQREGLSNYLNLYCYLNDPMPSFPTAL